MAQHRHKRETTARRPKAIQIAAPIAIMATVSAVSLGVLTASPRAVDRADNLVAASSDSAAASISSNSAPRDDIVSRSASRQMARTVALLEAKQEKKAAREATLKAIKRADTTMWTTADLNLWSGPDPKAEQVGVLDGIEKVLLTGRKDKGRVEVVINARSRWVTPGYFSKDKPETGPALGGACTNGSAIDAGSASLYEIHDVVCANWPEVTSYGTWRSDGEHGQGRAIDIMVNGETGWQIAEFLRANYSALGIEYLIYSQQMWSVERGGEGWRSMSDRGSTTANHYDHVHVTVY